MVASRFCSTLTKLVMTPAYVYLQVSRVPFLDPGANWAQALLRVKGVLKQVAKQVAKVVSMRLSTRVPR